MGWIMPPRRIRVLFCVLLAVLCLLAVVTGALADHDSHDDPAIENVTFSGDGYIDEQHDLIQDPPDREFLWRRGDLNISVMLSPGETHGESQLCGRAYDEGEDDAVLEECSSVEVDNETAQNQTLIFPGWPEGSEGNYTIVFELTTVNDEGEVVTVSESVKEVIIIRREGDFTGDGLTNEEEVELGTDFTVPDTIGNGLTDWEEARIYGTDPLRHDTTGDGITDASLVRFGLDPTDPYVAHRYAIVLVLFLATITFGLGVLIRRAYTAGPIFGRGKLPSGEGNLGPLATESANESSLHEMPDESILTNEEYVHQLLKNNNNRMRQRQIVDITDWSKAKVSRVLSELEDQGKIRKIQVGRENVIDLEED